MKNEHLYSLRTIRKLLALADRVIPYNTAEWLFRTPGDEDAVNALKRFIRETKIGHDAERTFVILKEKIAEYNATFKEESLLPLLVPLASDKELKRGKKEKQPELTELKIKKSLIRVNPIGALEWASFYKHLIQNGNILNLTSLETNAAWHIFLHQLRNIHTVFTREDLTKSADGAPALLRINEDAVQQIWLDFIGQLCLIGNEESAKVIHQYIHLATKVLAGQRPQGMTEDSAGSMVLSVLLAGLDLSEVLVLPEGDTTDQKYQASAAAHRFFPRIAPILITMAQFQQPFDAALYAMHKQNKELYSVTLAAAQKLLWQDVARLNAPLNEVIFQSPKKITQIATETPAITPLAVDSPVESKRDSQDKRDKPGTFLKLFQLLSVSDRGLIPPPPITQSPKESSNKGSNRSSPKGAVTHIENLAPNPSSSVETRIGTKPVNIVRTNSDQKMSPSAVKALGNKATSPLSITPVTFAVDTSDSERDGQVVRPLTPRFSARVAVPIEERLVILANPKIDEMDSFPMTKRP